MSKLKDQILALRTAGASYRKIQQELQCSTNTIYYHLNKKGREANNLRNIKVKSKVKQSAIGYKGGKCVMCGYNKCNSALEFHHTDPTQKDKSQYKGLKTWLKFETLKPELDKCILVCCRCHREIHAALDAIKVEVGEVLPSPTSPKETS